MFPLFLQHLLMLWLHESCCKLLAAHWLLLLLLL
jgi:hypothetical protein